MSKRRIIVAAIVLPSVVGLAVAFVRQSLPTYPYGRSHCCIIGMAMALQDYAESHDGRYPAGEPSPGASLTLLYRSHLVDANTLRGMTVPESTVAAILGNGGSLGANTCGWHYVEGLTRSDDARLALLYCGQPLGHNGQLTDGGRQVVFVGGQIEWVSGDQWTAFLAEQARLLARRSAAAKIGTPLVAVTIVLPDGSEAEQVDHYTLMEEQKGPLLSSSGSQSASGLRRSSLCFYHPPIQDGTILRTLSFSNLVSDPVTVTFANGVPDQTDVVFRMHPVETSPAPPSPLRSTDPDRKDDGSGQAEP
ncbi:MAG TPA: hypothetical protein PK867_23380 [Pirellulales bacterium]|nr:hypothetical protein [Pirellulales bacterium]